MFKSSANSLIIRVNVNDTKKFLVDVLHRRFSFNYRSINSISNEQAPSTTIRNENYSTVTYSSNKPRVLITGSFGQLGFGLAKLIRNRYGRDNVIMTDIVKPQTDIIASGPFTFIDVLDRTSIESAVVKYGIDWIIHFSALLSSIGEQNVSRAIQVNIGGLHNIFEVAQKHKLSVFVPSTIGAFGPESPRNIPTPDFCIQRPKTIYGVSKVHAELLGEYFNHKNKLNFRSLRLPGIISADSQPGGGTTDYAVDMFHQAYDNGSYECYLKPDTRLPMMYIDDCLRSIVELMEAPEQCLQQRTYNIHAMDLTPMELATVIRQYVPNFEIRFSIDARQSIADTWPQALNDQAARRDWNWNHNYDLNQLCQIMFKKISETRTSKYLNHETLNKAVKHDQQHKSDCTQDDSSIHHSRQQQQMAY
ncbi:L-threonine dehydrogenase [Dermatophagoides pteronyssinus]|uniref:Uncharacterized protein n=2 Tax=Dermatophagoides pteronyssinus TaxID=6956 RepID=A0ABQ8JW67_DERPT|nr:L-threonine 3-dehydrogenase, mitochondrial-like [Dermatophagoides pteronyssinus]KAH9426863.1 hypothetical protein DERP_002963 [Dermatophagoides pteronyssinus]